jgi:hypothetical protein
MSQANSGDLVYEICAKCDGTGMANHVDGPKPCDLCTLLRVVAIPNVSRDHVKQLIRRDIMQMLDLHRANASLDSLRGPR